MEAVNIFTWAYHPVTVALSKDGNAPARLEDANRVEYQVWCAITLECVSNMKGLWMRLMRLIAFHTWN